MAKNTNVKNLCDRELLEKILSIVEEKVKSPVSSQPADSHCLYDNKTLMAKLGIKDKYLKKLRDNGAIHEKETNTGTHRRMLTAFCAVSITRISLRILYIRNKAERLCTIFSN